jgi:hypothetical protein
VFIELVDHLRCPRPHEETWLVASADRTEGRDIVEGTLGCPICHAEYPIRRGVVWFRAPDGDAQPAPIVTASGDDPEAAMRVAALLDLSDAAGFALLAGSWARHAHLVREIAPSPLVLLNPAPPVDAESGISVLETPGVIPLAEATCRGVALDAPHADPARSSAAVRVLRPRGRLVAPASAPLPPGVTELARDAELWVAERDAAPKLVVLGR